MSPKNPNLGPGHYDITDQIVQKNRGILQFSKIKNARPNLFLSKSKENEVLGPTSYNPKELKSFQIFNGNIN